MDFEGTLEPVTLGRNEISYKKRPPMRWIPSSIWGKYALGWSLLQLVLTVALELYIMTTHLKYLNTVNNMVVVSPNYNNSTGYYQTSTGQLVNWSTTLKNGEAITVYHGLFIAAQFFQVILITDALMQLSLIQLMTSTAFNIASWGYAIVQLGQASHWLPSSISSTLPDFTRQPTQGAEVALIIVYLGFCIGWVFLAYKLYYVFGWTSYKEMGADLGLRNILHLYHIYIMLLKIDVFFFLGFDIQFLFLILKVSGSASDLLVHSLISFPGTIVALAVAYYAVRKENKMLVYVTLFLCIGVIGYLCSKLYDIWGASNNARFESSKNSLTFFISLTILVTLSTMAAAVVNMNHFGEGLMQKLDNPNGSEQDAYDGGNSAFELTAR